MEEPFAVTAGPSRSSGSKARGQGPCRICLQPGTLSVYDKVDFNMIKAIKCLTGLNILKNDPFTKLICIKCYTLLRGAVSFRRKARKSYGVLQEQFKSKNDVNYIIDSFIVPQADNGKNVPTTNALAHALHPSQVTPKYSDSESDIEPISVKDEPMSAGDEKSKPNEPKKIQCDKCLQFVPRTYFNGHMLEHNGTFRPDGKLECKICGKVMLRRSFKNHITIMHNEEDCRKYVCEQCGRVFNHQGSYHGHIITHKNEYPFKCTQCDYKGASESYLKAHMRSHSKEHRYQCSECPAQFSNNGNLTKHILKHKGKNMKCSECDKCFYTKSEVEKHYEVEHLGIKKYACNICNKLFGYRSSMMKHTLGVHKRPSLGHGRTPCYLKNQLKDQL